MTTMSDSYRKIIEMTINIDSPLSGTDMEAGSYFSMMPENDPEIVD
jgi:hypothetical protein